MLILEPHSYCPIRTKTCPFFNSDIWAYAVIKGSGHRLRSTHSWKKAESFMCHNDKLYWTFSKICTSIIPYLFVIQNFLYESWFGGLASSIRLLGFFMWIWNMIYRKIEMYFLSLRVSTKCHPVEFEINSDNGVIPAECRLRPTWLLSLSAESFSVVLSEIYIMLNMIPNSI